MLQGILLGDPSLIAGLGVIAGNLANNHAQAFQLRSRSKCSSILCEESRKVLTRINLNISNPGAP